MKKVVGVLLLLAGLTFVGAAGAEEIDWSAPSTDAHAPGSRYALKEGDFSKAERIVFYVSYPPHLTIPTYFHDVPVKIEIVSGRLISGGNDGTAPDVAKGVAHEAGSQYTLPAKTTQWLATGDHEAVIRVTMDGPFAIHWLK